jgi:serine/threonine-protein kinase
MTTRSGACDADRLRRLAEDSLGPDELAAVERHLEGCGGCRDELDRITGEDGGLELIRLHLSDGGTIGYDPGATFGGEALDFLAPTDWPDSLGRVGTYEVKGVIGRGGMGVVLKAFDPTLSRNVAIKVMSAALASSAAARRRFLREARAAAAVVHEHLVAVHAVVDVGGLPFLVMEYVPGGSLQDRLDRGGALGLAEVLRIGMQAASGLAAAHAQGLVHRDIKPANILLGDGVERVRLTDFGLARVAADAAMTQSGVVAGTPHYMAPEQARGEATDHRSDLFSLGSTLYAMCAGHPPFRAESAVAVLRRVCDDEPRPLREVNPDVPEWLETIVARLMAKDPERRYQGAAEVADVLGRCLAHVQQPLAVRLPAGLTRRRRVSMRGAAIAGGGLVAVVCGALVFVAPGMLRPRVETKIAPRATPASAWGGADDVDRAIGEVRGAVGSLEGDLMRVDAAGGDALLAELEALRGRAEVLERELGVGRSGPADGFDPLMGPGSSSGR